MRRIILKDKKNNEIVRRVWTSEEFISRDPLKTVTADYFKYQKGYKTKKGVTWFNAPITFDIETSTTTEGEDTYTWVYHWQVCILNVIIVGRTWEDFQNLLRYIKKSLKLNDTRKAIIYVHNLRYEFQFFHSQFKIKKVFARLPREPLIVELDEDFSGFRFLCTYSISGKSLESLSKDVEAIPFVKDKSDIDHTKIRTYKTRLTNRELVYCVKDVLIPYYYIKYLIEKEKNKTIYTIPITKTGFIRRDSRDSFGKEKEFKKLFEKLKLDAIQYILYNQAFRGGDTHANAWACGEILDGVEAVDISSSYPYRIIAEDMPLSPPRTVINPTIKELNFLLENDFLFVICVNLENIKLKEKGFTYIPINKCNKIVNEKNDNGRVVSADFLQTTVTSIDFKLMLKYYDFNIAGIPALVYHAKKGLLPQSIRDFVLSLYRDKTKLKGIPERQEQYRLSKEAINSVYGMTVTSPLNDTIEFDNGEWLLKKLMLTLENKDKIQKELDKFYKNRKSFLPYELGVWITTYARQDLHRALQSCGSNAVYWDTDSCKFINSKNFYEKLNNEKIKRLKQIGYQEDDYVPCDIKGNRHVIGLWEREYSEPVQFKTFGAKKYFIKEGEKESITVAGLAKSSVTAIQKTFGSVLNVELGSVIPKGISGRTSSEYHEEPFELFVNGEWVSERSYMNIIPCEYTFGDTYEHLFYSMTQKIKEERR